MMRMNFFQSCEICKTSHCRGTCPSAPEPPVMGYCKMCNDELRYDYNYFRDTNDDIFCSRECADAFHGITEEERSSDDIKGECYYD